MKRLSKLQKAFLGVVLFFVALILGGWWFENWRGEKQWEAAKKRAESMGVALEREAWIVEIPAEEDLLKDPLFYDEVFVREDEDRLKRWSKLPEVDDQSKYWLRPSAGETTRYREWFEGDLSEEEAIEKLAKAASGMSKRLDALAEVIMAKPAHPIFRNRAASKDIRENAGGSWQLLNPARSYNSAAMIALRRGDSTRALKYLQVLNRLGEISAEPALANYLIAGTIDSIRNSAIWEGIRLRAWGANDLKTLANLLSVGNQREELSKAYQFEVALDLDWLDATREDYQKGELDEVEEVDDEDSDEQGLWFTVGGPEGWHDQRKAFLVNRYLDFIEKLEGKDPLDLEGSGIDASQLGRYSPVRSVAASSELNLDVLPTFYQKIETARRIARVGIALEQYFQANDSYPADLSELKMGFPIKDLTDPKGRDLAYQIGKDGRPEIWSIYDASPARKGIANLRWQFWSDEPPGE